MSALVACASEVVERFECFGGSCAVLVQGSGPAGRAPEAAALAKRRLLAWHGQFSRFEPSSELSLLNADPRETVPVSAMMVRFVEAALAAAAITGGLVDPTLVDQLERAGYARDFAALSAPPADRLPDLPRRPAAPNPASRWGEVAVDRRHSTVSRPAGVRLDSGGIAKGLFGDVLAGVLSWHESFAVAAAGDVRFGGAAGLTRQVQITSPFDAGVIIHRFELADGAVATSGITRRRWIDDRGRLAHHLLDPATGEPVFTGVAQATALAPSGVEAEALAKAALLSGPRAAPGWLRHGGVLVYDDGSCDVVDPVAYAEAA
ncbi:MAG TPA: FAD:protein FMN transferase [Solirubrobacteraceae bacterium]|jgi:thiamine biosynthesis lipoprotein